MMWLTGATAYEAPKPDLALDISCLLLKKSTYAAICNKHEIFRGSNEHAIPINSFT